MGDAVLSSSSVALLALLLRGSFRNTLYFVASIRLSNLVVVDFPFVPKEAKARVVEHHFLQRHLRRFFIRRSRADEKAFRTWGYPWAPAIFCLVSLAIVLNTIAQAPGVASLGLGVMAAGIPMYWWMRRRTARTASAASH